MATCKGRKKDATPCRSPIVLDNGYCRAHQDQAPEEPVRWTRERLEAAISAHDCWIQERLDAGIATHHGPVGLDLAGADLSNLDLQRTNLGDANLQGANLMDATLQEAMLGSANLQGVILLRADLQSALLPLADLQGADLRSANLQGALMGGANLQEADLGSANLQGANLVYANLRGGNLGGANLQGAILEGADLQGANLTGVTLQGAILVNANLQEAVLGSLNRLQEVFTLPLADLQGANLEGADLQGANLTGVTLQGAILVNANLEGAKLEVADLQEANLTGTTLQGANLASATLQGANLQGANLGRVDLLDVRKGGLLGIKLYRARLDHTALKKGQLGPAIGDEQAGEYREARDAYLALKQNFEGLGDYEAASWSYIKERQMEKACSAPWQARRFYGEEQLGDTSEHKLPAYHPRVWWFFVRHTAKWLSDGLVELVCGYGERPWRTVATMVVVFAVFVGIYWATWAVMKVEETPKAIVRVPTRNLIDLAVFGLGAFTTMDPKGLEPAVWVQFVAGFEALLGIGLTGLLGFVLGNRIRRS